MTGTLEALRAIDGPKTRIRGAFAYISRGGVLDLYRSLSEALSTSTQTQWVISFDFGHTHPQGIAILMATQHSHVKIMEPESVLTSSALSPRRTFHPKTLWTTGDEGNDILIGSANMTEAGLSRNWESGMLLSDVGMDNEIVDELGEWWRSIWDAATTCSVSMLEEYAERRKERMPQTSVRDLARKVTDFSADVDEANLLWAQVGYASGGGRNQIDLPARLGPFFGLPDSFIEDERREPTFVYEGRSIERVAKYHGNDMTRIYLPTTFQGERLRDIESLEDFFVIFERIAEGRFSVSLVPPARIDEVIGRVRSKSEALGQVDFANERPCGWL